MNRGSQPSSTRRGLQGLHHQLRTAGVVTLPRQRAAVCERQLIVTKWPDAIDPLIIVPLSHDTLSRLKPGFAVWSRTSLIMPHHPRAYLEHRPGLAALYVAGHQIAHGSATDDLTEDQCMVGIVDRSLMSLWSADSAELFIDLLELGKARIADVSIREWQPCEAAQDRLHRSTQGRS